MQFRRISGDDFWGLYHIFFHGFSQFFITGLIVIVFGISSCVSYELTQNDRNYQTRRSYFLSGISGKTMPNHQEFNKIFMPSYALGINFRNMTNSDDPIERINAFKRIFGSGSTLTHTLLRDYIQFIPHPNAEVVIDQTCRLKNFYMCANGASRKRTISYLTGINTTIPRIPPAPNPSNYWMSFFLPVLIWYSVIGLILQFYVQLKLVYLLNRLAAKCGRR